jgi:hypothetical protein
VPDFGPSAAFNGLIPAFKAKQKHQDLFRLVEAIGQFRIPTTFDGEVPEFVFGQAVALSFYIEEENRSCLFQERMTDAELVAYRSHPETYFGVHRELGGNLKTPLDMFEWLHKNYSKTPRTRLLEFLKNATDIDELSKLPDDELLLVYCDRMTGGALAQASKRGPQPSLPPTPPTKA